MSQCQCSGSGWCATHRRNMAGAQHRECRDKPGYWQAYHVGVEDRGDNPTVKRKRDKPPKPKPPCIHLGGKVSSEACECGGESVIAVHACQAIKTASGSPKRCVATRKQLRRIKDESLHLVLLACDRCDKYEPKSPELHTNPVSK